MTFDFLIIGGGINGCAIAREAAVNGLSVLLVEKNDLASATSSASTKLIHGGLRYLEYYEFALVREALKERERLLKAAPHLIRPLQLVLPHENAVRPWWLVRLGLLIYDRLGGRTSLPRSRGLSPKDTALIAPLKGTPKGFVYYDGQVDDSRLTILNAIDAADNGAEIATRTELVSARREGEMWRAMLSDGREIAARAIVNAAGPWVVEALAKLGVNSASKVRLVKGSHIVVPRMYAGDHAYMLQQPDSRVVFAIPYLDAFTMIGTTDVAVDTPGDPAIDDAEIAYLCEAANRAFAKPIAAADIVSTWSGVRPLYDDGASEAKAVTRDYVLELDDAGPPLLSIFGGKITTARHLAEEAVGKLLQNPAWLSLSKPSLPLSPTEQNRKESPSTSSVKSDVKASHRTRARPYPGGAIDDFPRFLADANARWPFLGERRAERMARAYGTLLHEMLADVQREGDMGQAFGAGFTEIEARWMRTREWARTAEDCLMRRSKLGLMMCETERVEFERWWSSAAAGAIT